MAKTLAATHLQAHRGAAGADGAASGWLIGSLTSRPSAGGLVVAAPRERVGHRQTANSQDSLVDDACRSRVEGGGRSEALTKRFVPQAVPYEVVALRRVLTFP